MEFGIAAGIRMLPSKYSIDYEAVLSDARVHGSANISLVIKERLASMWRDVYLSTISHEPNLVRLRYRTFDYICDVYSQLELAGSVPFDQTIADRVIGVLGTSSGAQQNRGARRTRGELTEELQGTLRDDGHFMAHSIGGGFDVNLFSQDRRLNRGWSPQGKIFVRWKNIATSRRALFASHVLSTPMAPVFPAG